MPIPETQFETWSHQGAIAQSRDTYATVKRALEATDTNFAGKNFTVFLQGSYCNDTNIYAESDVDVVIRLDSVYYYDTSDLAAPELAAFRANLVPGTYPYAEYKADVLAAMQSSFGAAAVKTGTKALRVFPNGNRRSADVIVAAEFRRYYSGVQYKSGICFFAPLGQRIVNYPKQHSANCTTKHQATSSRFKPMVRIFKNMRGKLVTAGVIKPGSAPSYFIEGLLYNVPAGNFGSSYSATFAAAVNWLQQADRSKLVCANEEYYLVRDSSPNCWPCNDYDAFLKGVIALWNNWR